MLNKKIALSIVAIQALLGSIGANADETINWNIRINSLNGMIQRHYMAVGYFADGHIVSETNADCTFLADGRDITTLIGASFSVDQLVVQQFGENVITLVETSTDEADFELSCVADHALSSSEMQAMIGSSLTINAQQ